MAIVHKPPIIEVAGPAVGLAVGSLVHDGPEACCRWWDTPSGRFLRQHLRAHAFYTHPPSGQVATNRYGKRSDPLLILPQHLPCFLWSACGPIFLWGMVDFLGAER